jgi:hypothetical protein
MAEMIIASHGFFELWAAKLTGGDTTFELETVETFSCIGGFITGGTVGFVFGDTL